MRVEHAGELKGTLQRQVRRATVAARARLLEERAELQLRALEDASEAWRVQAAAERLEQAEVRAAAAQRELERVSRESTQALLDEGARSLRVLGGLT
jgi:hypothetical protein